VGPAQTHLWGGEQGRRGRAAWSSGLHRSRVVGKGSGGCLGVCRFAFCAGERAHGAGEVAGLGVSSNSPQLDSPSAAPPLPPFQQCRHGANLEAACFLL
jgi:hypothetical protein